MRALCRGRPPNLEMKHAHLCPPHASRDDQLPIRALRSLTPCTQAGKKADDAAKYRDAELKLYAEAEKLKREAAKKQAAAEAAKKKRR